MKISKRLFNNFNFLFFMGTFILIFNPPIFSFNTMHIVGVCSLLYMFVNFNKTVLVFSKKDIWILFLSFVGIFLYLFSVVCLHNDKPISYVVMPLYYILDIIPFGVAVRIYSDKHNCKSQDFINLMIQAGKLQAILAIAAFFIPSIHKYFLNMLIDYGYTDYFKYLSNYRIFGLASSLTFAMPVVQTVFALILLHPECRGKTNIPSALILFFSALINARVSIIVAGIGFIVLVLFGSFSISKKIRMIVVVLVAFICLIYFILPLIEQYSPWTYKWMMSGVDDIWAFLGGDNSGRYFSYATSAEQYKVPDDFVDVLVGKGHSTMGLDAEIYGYQSDVGFINDIWLGGVLYVFFLYCLHIKYMCKLFKSSKSLVSFIGILMLIVSLIINIKGQAFAKASFSIFFFLVCVVEMSKTQIDEK